MGAAWLADRIESNPTLDHLIAAPTYKILQQSTLKKFFQEFPHYRDWYKSSDGVIEHPAGGSIYVRTADEPYKLEGMTIFSAWLDEAGQMKPDIWSVIQARVAINRGSVLITTTPYNMGWLHSEFYNQWKDGDPNFLVVNWSSEQNPFFPKEEFDRIQKVMDPVTFDMRYRGFFRKRHGLVYPDFTDEMIVRSDEPKLRGPFNSVIGGIDWGFTNPAGIVVIGVDWDGHYTVLDEYYSRQRTTSEIVSKARAFQSLYRVNVFYADSAEPDRIKEGKISGLYIQEANKDVKLGIDRVRQMIREKRFHVNRKCMNLIDELENYHYPEEGEPGFIKDVPKKEHDHLMDALRYAIYTYSPKGPDLISATRINRVRNRNYDFK